MLFEGSIDINKLDSFLQFAFGNADFNTNTLDGLNTFHAMGGIQYVTPKTAISPDQIIPRLTRMPSATALSLQYRPMESLGLQAVNILDLQSIRPVSTEVVPLTSDFLWLYGKWVTFSSISGWNGFMDNSQTFQAIKSIMFAIYQCSTWEL